MVYVGIDDTDTLDSRGTNQLARRIAWHFRGRLTCRMIIRHQLLEDPRVPCTSKNGSASLTFEAPGEGGAGWLIPEVRAVMQAEFVPGSDPGFCVADHIPVEVVEFGRRAKSSWIEQDEARALARQFGIYLEGLGGTQGGVIGALAAVGLAATRNDGRIVQLGEWDDDLSGIQDAAVLRARRIEIYDLETQSPVSVNSVDVGKRLRPNVRLGRAVVFVRPGERGWEAVRLK